MVQYLLVALLNRLTHTAMAMSALFCFVLFRRVPSTDIALFTVRLLCICVNARENVQNPIELRVIFMFAHKDRVAECTKRGRAAVIVVLSPVPLTQPSQLFSLSATLAHMPVSCNCGLIPSLSIFFLFFFLLNHPLLSLSCRSVASNDLSPCFLLLALPCSTSSIFHPIIFSPLSLSPSFLLSFLLQTQCSSV